MRPASNRMYLGALAVLVGLGSAEAAVHRFRCQVSEGKAAMPLEFVYDDVTNEAFVTGNAGTAQVRAYVGEKAITLLEFLKSGVVQTDHD